MGTRLIGPIAWPALLVCGGAWSHHSVLANFDRSRTIELQGTIRDVFIRNPHSQYVLTVTADDGREIDWFIEWSDRNALLRRGVDLDVIEPGDELTITVWPSRQLERVGYFVRAILPSGEVYRDCGFVEYRRAVESSEEFRCPEGEAR